MRSGDNIETRQVRDPKGCGGRTRLVDFGRRLSTSWLVMLGVDSLGKVRTLVAWRIRTSLSDHDGGRLFPGARCLLL